jgi:hypothetical protein
MKITTDKTLTMDQKDVGQLNALLYQMYTRFGYFGNSEPSMFYSLLTIAVIKMKINILTL